MRSLYNNLRSVLESVGFNVAMYGENTIDYGERTLEINIGEIGVIQPGFNIIEAQITLTLVHDNEWEMLSGLISDALHSFIPIQDRVSDEEMKIADNSELMELVDIPEITNMILEIDEATGTEYQSISYSLKYVY